MNSGTSKKVIFFFFLVINLYQPLKSADFKKIDNNDDNEILRVTWSRILPIKSFGNITKPKFDKIKRNFLNRKNFTKDIQQETIQQLNFYDNENTNELVIQSDKQSEKNNIIDAAGNVLVFYKGKLLKADRLIYDKPTKKISVNGNISLIIGNQIFKASKLEYSLINEKGYLLDVKGYLNSNTLIDDLLSNFKSADISRIESLFDFKDKEVVNTPGKVENWIFSTDKMSLDGKTFKSKKAVFSNDLLELKQVKLVINSLEVIPTDEKIRFKSSLNYLIFEETISIPLWFGDRTLTKYAKFFDFKNRWNLGYENLDKDGYFIGRKLNSINISDNLILDLELQYLIQRSLKGYTKSFVKKDQSITSEKIKRNAGFKDYFALKSQIKGKLKNWDLEIEKNLNSFDFDKFPDAFRLKTNLSKEINFLNTKWQKSFYGVYRDRVWNGSLGEAEIYRGFGSKLKKENTWGAGGIKKTELLSLGLANYTAEALNSKNLITNQKGNIFYKFDQKIPISVEVPKTKSIDISYSYIPEPITKGLSINSRIEASYSFYDNGNHQEYLGLGLGPEIIFGNFKNKILDYTRVSILPFYKAKSGESVFKFDQNYDNFTLNLDFDQQLYGSLILKSNGTLNLTSNSDDYGEFIDSKISINWKKRSYEFGIFYQPHNQSGGISFELYGFE